MIFEIQKRGLALEAIFTHRGWTLLSYIVLFAPETAFDLLF
jgi:hypothetical protein